MSAAPVLILIALWPAGIWTQNIAQTFTLPPFGNGPFSVQAESRNVIVESLDSAPSGNPNSKSASINECSEAATQLCNQQTWTDYGLAISGITPKQDLCQKYVPDNSCLALSLSTCLPVLNNMTKTMMLAFARVIVSWCYDGGVKLKALSAHNECLSLAIFDAVTTKSCLLDVVAPLGISQTAQKNADGLQLSKLLNNLVGTYQSSTIICMHKSIEDACGKEAADLSLAPALEELSYISEFETEQVPVLETSSSDVDHKHFDDDEQFQKKNKTNFVAADSQFSHMSSTTSLNFLSIGQMLFCVVLSVVIVL